LAEAPPPVKERARKWVKTAKESLEKLERATERCDYYSASVNLGEIEVAEGAVLELARRYTEDYEVQDLWREVVDVAGEGRIARHRFAFGCECKPRGSDPAIRHLVSRG